MIGGNPKDGAVVNKANFNGEKMSMISSIFRDTNKVSEKMSHIVVKIMKGDKTRSVGQISLNLANYVDCQDESDKITMTLEKCPDPNGYLEFSICSTLISTGVSDTMSMMSGFDTMSIDSTPDTNMNFNANDSMA